MKFLIDKQLPPALARYFHSRGHASLHVDDIGLGTASDSFIRHLAIINGFILVTKDAGFAKRHSSSFPVLWIKFGNCRNDALIASIEARLPDILQAFSMGASIIELE